MKGVVRIGRTIPPAAARIGFPSVMSAFSGMFFAEKYLRTIEEEMRGYFGVDHVFLVSSGKAALAIILEALRSLAPERDEVLMPAYTCYSVPSAVVKVGLRVQLCDIDLETLDYDHSLLAQAVTSRTLCVVTGNLFGVPSDVGLVKEICDRRGAFVVEDVAQAMGGEWRGRKIGTVGDVGFFSFGRGKNVTCGSGGMIITGSKPLAEALRLVYDCAEEDPWPKVATDFAKLVALAVFIKPSRFWFPLLLPFLRLGETIFYPDFPVRRLSGMGAGALLGWERKLMETNRARETNANYFIQRLPACQRRGTPFLRLPLLAASRAARDRICALSARRGLGVGTMYPAALNKVPELRQRFRGREFPSASEASQRLLCLPTHEGLEEQDRRSILSAISTGIVGDVAFRGPDTLPGGSEPRESANS